MNNLGSPSQNILTGQTERIASVTHSQGTRVMSKILVAATFLLLIAGALVTGNKAALSDPTWPQFVGHAYPKYWVGGLVYEDSHRLVAGTVGILTFIMALMLQLKDPRKFMKKLGWSAFALVIVQAIFGGLVIKSIRHPAISMAHGVIAQSFFCVTIAIAIFSSVTWFKDKARPQVLRSENQPYLTLMKLTIFFIFLQVVMGGGVRHSNDAGDMFFPFLIAHIAGAFSVIILITWFGLRTYHVYKDVTPLRRTAAIAGSLVVFQVILGILSIFANRARLDIGMAHLHHVITSTMHLMGGGTLLALMFGSYLRARQLLDHSSHNVPSPAQAHQTLEVNS